MRIVSTARTTRPNEATRHDAVLAPGVRRYPLRTSMLLLAIAIGVAAVVMLTAVGEGARRYVTGQFQSLGTNLLIVLPASPTPRAAAASRVS